MSLARILVQIDSDVHASTFDSVVAIDAGVQQLLCYHGVQPADVRSLVHGALFTRGPRDLRNTAIFVGGASVSAGERLLDEIKSTFFGPMRVSVMLDANGANTTAAAAVLAVERHLRGDSEIVVLAATGPVGQRVVRLLGGNGHPVRVVSRDLKRAAAVCEALVERIPQARTKPYAVADDDELRNVLDGAHGVVAAGAAGISLLPGKVWQSTASLKLAIDLNAVPPLGIEEIEVSDKGRECHGVIGYGAIGIGATKMKIHKAAIQRLFESNDQVLDAESIFALGRNLESNAAS